MNWEQGKEGGGRENKALPLGCMLVGLLFMVAPGGHPGNTGQFENPFSRLSEKWELGHISE